MFDDFRERVKALHEFRGQDESFFALKGEQDLDVTEGVPLCEFVQLGVVGNAFDRKVPTFSHDGFDPFAKVSVHFCIV